MYRPALDLSLRRQRLNIPDRLCVLLYTPVAAEEAHAGYARDRLGEPLLLVLVCLVDQGLCLDVTVKVIADEVIVTMFEDGADESGEVALVAKGAFLDGFEDLAQVGVDFVLAVVVVVSEVFHVLGQVAEEEDVALTNFARDFNLACINRRQAQGKEYDSH